MANEYKLDQIKDACEHLNIPAPTSFVKFEAYPAHQRRKVLRCCWLRSVGIGMDDFKMKTTGSQKLDSKVLEAR